MFDDIGGSVEGEMNVPQSKTSAILGQPEFNTLDEPIKDTIVGYNHCILLKKIIFRYFPA